MIACIGDRGPGISLMQRFLPVPDPQSLIPPTFPSPLARKG